jgi:hypothetical protein
MIVMVALLLAPETYHHYVEYNTDTGRFHQLISWMADCALLPFALSLGIALFIIGNLLAACRSGRLRGCFFVTVALGCWYGLEYLRRQQTRHKERATTAREQTTAQMTSLEQRITQMLTERESYCPVCRQGSASNSSAFSSTPFKSCRPAQSCCTPQASPALP